MCQTARPAPPAHTWDSSSILFCSLARTWADLQEAWARAALSRLRRCMRAAGATCLTCAFYARPASSCLCWCCLSVAAGCLLSAWPLEVRCQGTAGPRPGSVCMCAATDKERETGSAVSWWTQCVSQTDSRTAPTSMRLNSYTSVCSPLPWQTWHTLVLARLLLSWSCASAPPAATSLLSSSSPHNNSHADSSQRACTCVIPCAVVCSISFGGQTGS